MLKNSLEFLALEIFSVVCQCSNLLFFPGVFKSDGLVEYRMFWSGVRIRSEVSDTLELQIGEWLHRGCIWLYITVLEDTERVGIDNLFHCCHSITVLLFTDSCHVVTRILYLPKAIVKTNLCFYGMSTTYSVEGLALDLTVRTWHTAT